MVVEIQNWKTMITKEFIKTIPFTIRRIQRKFKDVVEKLDVRWLGSPFGDDIMDISDETLLTCSTISINLNNNFVELEIAGESDVARCYIEFEFLNLDETQDNDFIYNFIKDEVNHLIEAGEMVYSEIRTIVKLDTEDLLRYKKVLEKLNTK